MSKKFLFPATAAMALCLSFAGCKQTQGQGETAESEGGNTNLKIAYVELDTLMSQYQLYKDYSEVLTVKGNNIQNTLSKKQKTLESHAAALQKKYDSNGFTTRDELERAQNSIQHEEAELQ